LNIVSNFAGNRDKRNVDAIVMINSIVFSAWDYLKNQEHDCIPFQS